MSHTCLHDDVIALVKIPHFYGFSEAFEHFSLFCGDCPTLILKAVLQALLITLL